MKPTIFLSLFFALIFTGQVLAQDHCKTEAPYFKMNNTDASIDDLPLKSTDVKVDITSTIADVTIYQTYENKGTKTLEATYVFPMSAQAAVYNMEMRIGERLLVADIQEKGQAREAYEQAISEGKTASLLEQERPNVFQMSVGNILPGDVIIITLKYTEYVLPEEGIYSFVFPTVVGPRYNNPTNNAQAARSQFAATPYMKSEESTPAQFSLTASLSSSVPIADIQSKTHQLEFTNTSSKFIEFDLKPGSAISNNRDFILEYSLRGKQIENGIQLYDHGDEKFFMAMVQPPKTIAPEEIPPREYIFLVDVSGSMNGFPIEVTKVLMRNLITNLKPDDRFNVVLFESSAKVLANESLTASEANINKAVQFFNQARGGGGTRMIHGLKTALNLPRHSEALSRSVIVVTDGYVTVEKEAMDLIKSRLDEMNVFAFGIGSSVNRYLIEGLAKVGQGLPFIITNKKEAAPIADRFRKYIQTPVLSNISVDYKGLDVYDLNYEKFPDLLSERPLVITGKYRGDAKGQIVVKGYSGKRRITQKIKIDEAQLSDDHNAIRYLWAREKIGLLDDYDNYQNNDESAKAAVTSLGLKYNLMTAYTSFVAIEKIVRRVDDQEVVSVKQALPLPEGVSEYAVGADFDLSGVFEAASPLAWTKFLWLIPFLMIGLFAYFKFKS